MTVWTDERVDQIKGYLRQGLSASQIAYRFGDGVTRNAIIGIIHRRGLVWSPKQAKEPRAVRPVRVRPPTLSMPKLPVPTAPALFPGLGDSRLGGLEKKVRNLRITRQVDALPLEPPPQPRGDRPSLLELKSGECKWPFGDPRHKDFHFCGARHAGEGEPYCSAHKAMATAAPGTGRKFDPEDNDLIRKKWNCGRGLPALVKELGRPGPVIVQHAIVTLRLPRMAA